MHTIEPFYSWRDLYIAAEDERSPFYGREYSEFEYSKTIYNYYIHPQWDDFGSATLYAKILYADYTEHFAVIELMGEWNDCLYNDIMFLKENIIKHLIQEGIVHFILIIENVLDFHLSDDCYYEEWRNDIEDENGWIAALNIREQVAEEMCEGNIDNYIHFNDELKHISWRTMKPVHLFQAVDNYMIRRLTE
ncbi:MAG: hypothetical protein IPL35_02795 [Sphingobacteriales bacterium]|nr:hypothetical protein [Sphingobacteriales bacterium]